ncbi:TlpA family protein disulfide reductase [Sphingobacterium sp. MYb388]|uniref:TlpA family protein disulfide reductase n=1 Tax=Sphingobacterium sp. MYb388 TaxID=2745437 RepID=UPI0030B403C7
MKNYIKSILLFSCILFLHNSIYAQKNRHVDLSKALKIGADFVPPTKVKLMRGKDKTIDWEALQDKVVLLDFFSTSCGTCIQIMPHLQELEQKHPDKFKVIVVTAHDKVTLEKFFKNNKYLKEHQVNLPVIYEDSYFHSVFPHSSEPHEVLLYQGKVQAITGSGSIDENNILKLYTDKTIALPLKDDYGRGNLVSQIHDSNRVIKAGAIFSGYQDGVPYQAWTFKKDSLTGLFKSSIYNTSLYSALLSLTARAQIKDSKYIPRMDRVQWKVKDSTKYHNFENKTDKWLVDHAISYERYDIKEKTDSLQARLILADFLSFYGLKAYEGKKKMNCLVLESCPVVPYSGTLINPMKYNSTATFAIFTDISLKFPPLIDHVNKAIPIEIGKYDTLHELNLQLAAYGMNAKIKLEEINILVIEEINE